MIKLDVILSYFLDFLHFQVVQIFFSISNQIQRFKVDFQLVDKFQPTKHLFLECLQVIDYRLEPVKCCLLKVGQNIINLAFIIRKGSSTCLKVEVALDMKYLEFFGIGPIEHIWFLDLGLFLQNWMPNGFYKT